LFEELLVLDLLFFQLLFPVYVVFLLVLCLLMRNDVEVPQSGYLCVALPGLSEIVDLANVGDALHSLGGALYLHYGVFDAFEVSVYLGEAVLYAVLAHPQLSHIIIHSAVGRYSRWYSIISDVWIDLLAQDQGFGVYPRVLLIEKFEVSLSVAEGPNEEGEFLPTVPQHIAQSVDVQIDVRHGVTEVHIKSLHHVPIAVGVDRVEEAKGYVPDF